MMCSLHIMNKNSGKKIINEAKKEIKNYVCK